MDAAAIAMGIAAFAILLGLIPFVGWIVVLIFAVLPGTPNQNRFG